MFERVQLLLEAGFVTGGVVGVEGALFDRFVEFGKEKGRRLGRFFVVFLREKGVQFAGKGFNLGLNGSIPFRPSSVNPDFFDGLSSVCHGFLSG